MFLSYSSLELPAFGLTEQVGRVFRNPGAFPRAPQNLLHSFEITCRSDVFRKPSDRVCVESFFRGKHGKSLKTAADGTEFQRVDEAAKFHVARTLIHSIPRLKVIQLSKEISGL